MSSPAPVAVVGIALHNGERHVAEAIESLAAQTFRDLRLVVVDDCSSDGSPRIVADLARSLPLRYVRNEERLGLVVTWRRAFDVAVSTYPEARYFAWGSDHDVWHHEWLAELVAGLRGHPRAVLAHPLADAIDEDGAPLKRKQRRFDTVGVRDPRQRVELANVHMRAGDMIYGLYRVEALTACGAFPAVLLPDRLLLARLALEGEFVQVPRVLWFRRYRDGVQASLGRQRRSLFGPRAAKSAYLPWWIVHAVVFFSTLPHRPVLERASLTWAYIVSARRALVLKRREVRERKRYRRRKQRRKKVARWRATAGSARRRLYRGAV